VILGLAEAIAKAVAEKVKKEGLARNKSNGIVL